MVIVLPLLIHLPGTADVTPTHNTVNSVSADSSVMMSCDTTTSRLSHVIRRSSMQRATGAKKSIVVSSHSRYYTNTELSVRRVCVAVEQVIDWLMKSRRCVKLGVGYVAKEGFVTNTNILFTCPFTSCRQLTYQRVARVLKPTTVTYVTWLQVEWQSNTI